MKKTFLPLIALLLFSCSSKHPSSQSSGEVSSQTSSQEATSLTSEESSPSESLSRDIDRGGVTQTTIAQYYTDLTEHSAYTVDSAPTIGYTKVLVVPVWFTDSPDYVLDRDLVHEDIELAYFGDEGEIGWHSVKSFYETESLDYLYMEGTVSEWYELDEPMAAYGVGAGQNKTVSLAKEATDWFFSAHEEEDRRDYDGDGDGYIDAVMLIYAAPDYVSLRREECPNLWAYCYWYQSPREHNVKAPGVNTFFWASYDFIYDRDTALTRAGTGFGLGDCRNCVVDSHTFIHEFGHCLGLDDYYDYGPNGYSAAASFSMQDHNIGGHDPFSLLSFGWVDPFIPTESCSIEITPFQNEHDLILLTPEWNDFDSPFDEYLLIELFTPTGLNELDCRYKYAGSYSKGPNRTGIRLWHVDARLLYVERDENFTETQMTSDALIDAYYGVTQAFTNTYGDEDYGSPLGSDYDKFDLLHLIRNSKTMTYKTSKDLEANNLFYDGDSFDMSTYSKQFGKSGKLDSGSQLGWSFEVAIEDSGASALATISLTKAD